MKSTPLAIIIAIVILGSAFYFVNTDNSPQQKEVVAGNTIKPNNLPTNDAQVKQNEAQADNVKIIDGKQIIEIQARGGYNPKMSTVKSGIPTIIRFVTNNTFDCSASIRIPSLGVSKMLPSVGNTDVDVGSPQIGLLQGSCGMGMYRFAVNFQ